MNLRPMTPEMSKYPRRRLRARSDHSGESLSAIDSYQNIPARLGVGTPNQANAGTYPLTRRTHDYMLMLSLYRSNWIVRKVVDVFAEDCLKDFPKLVSEIKPEQVTLFDRIIRKTGALDQMRSAMKWGRLFGGAIGVMVIKGHDDLMQPLEIDDVEPGSFMGIIPLDRWSGVQPDPEIVRNLDDPRAFGLPRSYTCTTESGMLNVHHSRVLRFTGRELPNWEKQTEQYWGLSEVELLFDELQKRDYTSWNIVSLLTRAQIMAMVEPELAAKQSGLAMSNLAYTQYVAKMTAIANSMNNQGLLVLPKDGSLQSHAYSFGGLAEVYNTFMLDVAGACEIPVSRLYGRTITGLGQSGEGDLQIYYDTVEQKRKRELSPLMDQLIPVICMSTFGDVPDDLDYSWPAVRTLNDKDRSDLADKRTTAVTTLFDSDLLTKKEARMEIKQAADETGLGTNITDEAIAATPDEYASEMGLGELTAKESESDSATDADRPIGEKVNFQGLSIAIENPVGSTRSGVARDGKKWSVTFKYPYGYIDGTTGADGDSIDCFLGPHAGSDRAFVIHQNDLDGNYDEDKVMLGYASRDEAKRAYFDHYDRPETFFGSMDEMSLDEFKGGIGL